MSTYIKSKRQLDEHLIINGLTQKDLAAAVGIGRTYMSAIANRSTPVGNRTAKKICDVLNVDFKDIFVLSMSTKVLHK
ncbi:helix-turn-helix transcriptional regulator [Companilactobacillus nantensis]|uniref:helix-turn-helix transcriptional regulator n=1 Tax=Companilactobacillus nantensis TaxID=305793 RepID=UPI00070E7A6C|nr:helix-turn-helix transcriptional regulator [Companilactobacillus nantensis]GEO63005.1 hypothetical protein LNA01_01880 [Companilactobacillus nantensis]